MYQEPQETTLAPGYGKLNATGAVDPMSSIPSTPLVMIANEQGEQIDKLASLLVDLQQRLSSVRNTSPQSQGENVAQEAAPASMLVNQLRSQTSSIKQLQIFVRDLMGELEV